MAEFTRHGISEECVEKHPNGRLPAIDWNTLPPPHCFDAPAGDSPYATVEPSSAKNRANIA